MTHAEEYEGRGRGEGDRTDREDVQQRCCAERFIFDELRLKKDKITRGQREGVPLRTIYIYIYTPIPTKTTAQTHSTATKRPSYCTIRSLLNNSQRPPFPYSMLIHALALCAGKKKEGRALQIAREGAKLMMMIYRRNRETHKLTSKEKKKKRRGG
jgi:hypothetical protein